MKKKQYKLLISSEKKWFDFNVKDIWNYRDLIWLFVKRDVTTFYKQTILGPLWFIIQPLISTIVFAFVFNKIARLPTDQIPPYLFYMSGIISWNYFSECMLSTTTTFTSNAYIFNKVYFPRLVLPVSKVISSMVKLFVQLLLFFGFLFYYSIIDDSSINISINIMLLPIMIVQMALFALSIGMIITSLTTKYRDLRFLVAFAVQLFMYATPIAYPISAIPEKYKYIILSNPMTPIITGFRYSLLGSGTYDIYQLLNSMLIILIIFLFGIIIFNRVEKTFLDTI